MTLPDIETTEAHNATTMRNLRITMAYEVIGFFISATLWLLSGDLLVVGIVMSGFSAAVGTIFSSTVATIMFCALMIYTAKQFVGSMLNYMDALERKTHLAMLRLEYGPRAHMAKDY